MASPVDGDETPDLYLSESQFQELRAFDTSTEPVSKERKDVKALRNAKGFVFEDVAEPIVLFENIAPLNSENKAKVRKYVRRQQQRDAARREEAENPSALNAIPRALKEAARQRAETNDAKKYLPLAQLETMHYLEQKVKQLETKVFVFKDMLKLASNIVDELFEKQDSLEAQLALSEDELTKNILYMADQDLEIARLNEENARLNMELNSCTAFGTPTAPRPMPRRKAVLQLPQSRTHQQGMSTVHREQTELQRMQQKSPHPSARGPPAEI